MPVAPALAFGAKSYGRSPPEHTHTHAHKFIHRHPSLCMHVYALRILILFIYIDVTYLKNNIKTHGFILHGFMPISPPRVSNHAKTSGYIRMPGFRNQRPLFPDGNPSFSNKNGVPTCPDPFSEPLVALLWAAQSSKYHSDPRSAWIHAKELCVLTTPCGRKPNFSWWLWAWWRCPASKIF